MAERFTNKFIKESSTLPLNNNLSIFDDCMYFQLRYAAMRTKCTTSNACSAVEKKVFNNEIKILFARKNITQ